MINLSDYDEIIPIGGCCEPTLMIANFKLSKTSYPFDYCLIKNISDISTVINNNFIDYTKLSEILESVYYNNQVMLKVGDTNIYIPHYHNIQQATENYKTKISDLKKLLV